MLAASRAEKRRETLRCEPTDEVAVLDDPYLSRYTLDDFPRLKAMRAEFFGARGEICTERPRLVTEYYREHGFETDADGREIDPELRQAGALHHVLVNKEPLIRDARPPARHDDDEVSRASSSIPRLAARHLGRAHDRQRAASSTPIASRRRTSTC